MKKQLKKLWKDIFFDDLNYIDWYFDNVYREKNTRVSLEKDRVNAMLFENRYHLSIQKDRFMGRYLVGIGVSPEKKGEGIMRTLLLESIREAYSFGEEFLYLTPIDKNIYERFGFAYISSLTKYTLPFHILKNFKKDLRVEKISAEECDEDILSQLEEFYRSVSKEFYLKVARNKNDYKNILSEIFCEEGIVYISFDVTGKINGYLFIVVKEDVTVKEFLFTEKKSLETLLSILQVYENYCENIRFFLPENTYLEDYFESENSIEKEIINKVQVRILRVEKVLKRIAENIEELGEVSIYIQDKDIKENNGVFRLKKDSVEKTDGDFDISLTIRDLAILAYGFRDFNSLKKLESFYVKNKNKESILNRLFTKRVNYFNQDF